MDPPILPQVNNLVFSGAGCSQGTANATWSPASWSDWTVSLHDLNLEATAKPGPGGLPSESDCTLHATFSNTSPGWQLALETVSIRGYAALSSGSSISAAASVSWAPTAGASGTGHRTAAPAPAERNVSLTNSRTMDEASAMGALLDFSSVPVWSGCSDGAELGNLALRFRFGVHVQTNSTNGYAAFGGLVDDGHGDYRSDKLNGMDNHGICQHDSRNNNSNDSWKGPPIWQLDNGDEEPSDSDGHNQEQ
ncbi:hypothetical protein HMPREF1624_05581 [Sporothrix schenckii ATCC 58251]|uniref:Uncharacterized protein n=1 Tax=Sporothrix schenckii (strain ATCC 58251 / de Perez 2211183) TaxID=1391915 RepID=U7PRS8_SPOS1|nr:hypothetical protein HMPREF1624_05581 [Sporothrix schenckii ATCC 58251]